jgi:solute carrier family 10 (sodium/bile acid cotransporter), member 7
MPVKIDRFVLAIIAVVVLGRIIPHGAGQPAGIILDRIATAGIFLIFFVYGLRLSTDKFLLGMKNWKLHLLIQSATFLLFPLVVLSFLPLVRTGEHEILWLGLFFMAAVPSTVASSVIMVSIGRGNIPGAIFNASLSGIIGIIITPLLMGTVIRQTGPGFDFTGMYLRLALGIILPVVAGLALQKRWYNHALKYSRMSGIFDKSVILLIVYKSFARSFNDEVFSDILVSDLIILVAIVVILFFLLWGIIYTISGMLRFSREDRITALFCGVQKSLVLGTVFASVIFSGFHAAGLILVPLMLFHAWQIFFISIIAGRYGQKYS